MWGDNGKANMWGDHERQWETRRQDLRKAETPSNPREGGHTITKKNKRVRWETRKTMTLGKADTPSTKGKQEGAQWETRKNKTLRKAYTPSHKGKQERVQWETKEDKTFGKADTLSNTKAETLR